MRKATAAPAGYDERADIGIVAEDVCSRLARGRSVRRTLPPVGSVVIEAHAPFLLVYRSPVDHSDAGAKDLVTTEAAYLFAAGEPEHAPGLQAFCSRLATQQRDKLGAFLLLEVWTSDVGGRSPGGSLLPRAAFRVNHDGRLGECVRIWQRALDKIRFGDEDVPVTLRENAGVIAPPDMAPLLENDDAVFVVGLEIHPFWRREGILFPELLRDFRARFSAAVRRGLFCFARERTKVPPRHRHELGSHRLVRATRTFDASLAEVSEAFDFLLQVTPINVAEAREQFARSGYERVPAFQYRPLERSPEELKRRLFAIPVDRLEDPAVAFLLMEKQAELDRQLTALRDLGTRHFLYTSLQLYGVPEPELVDLATALLERLPARGHRGEKVDTMDAEDVRRRSLEHIAWYRHREPTFEPAVEIRGDIASGMLVSRGTLFISAETHPTPQRFEALLQHEIGTHLVTHFNGGAQPFTQLRSGLAGYEALQEGLAVLAEYLVGGLTPGRVRLLAARVLAVDWIVRGAEFVEVFRRLVNDWNFPAAQATTVAVRTFRGGGYIKDQVYLRGFRELVSYLAAGHALEPLYLGKIALGHLPYLEELRHRRIVRAPRLLPQYMERPDFASRLAHVRTSSPLTLLTEFPEVP